MHGHSDARPHGYLVSSDGLSGGGVDSGADAVLARVGLSTDGDDADRLSLGSRLGRRHSFHHDASVTHRLRYRRRLLGRRVDVEAALRVHYTITHRLYTDHTHGMNGALKLLNWEMQNLETEARITEFTKSCCRNRCSFKVAVLFFMRAISEQNG